jgi:hypothetical protein
MVCSLTSTRWSAASTVRPNLSPNRTARRRRWRAVRSRPLSLVR